MGKVLFNRDDVLDWKQNAVTQHFLKTLKEDRDNIIESWAAGDYTSDSADGTTQLNAKALGNLHALENVISTLKDYQDTFDFEEAEYA